MPKGTRKIGFSFDETHITHFGGMWLIQRFCNKLRLRWLIQKYVRTQSRTALYHPAEMVMALIVAIIMGLRRINKTEILQYNGAFLEMLGLKRFPDQSTLRRFLKRLPTKSIRQLARLHDSLRAHLFAFPHPRSTLIFDLDSVVIVIYGRAEGARIGYNPKKRGRRSYHPLLCFEAHFQEFWHGTLRPGNTISSTGVVPFLKICLVKVPQQIARSRIRLRMDSGFYRSRDTVSRRERVWLCDGGQGVPSPQEAGSGMQISKVAKRLAGRRVLGESLPQVKQAPSRCGAPPSHSTRSGRSRTVDSVQGQKVCLPPLCHQSRNQPLAGLS